jgi:hypothetical protein
MCLGLAPWFVVVGDALLALPLPWMTNISPKAPGGKEFVSTDAPWRVGLLVGIEGLVIWGTSVIAFGLCG